MSEQLIDRLAVAVAARGSRRSFLAGAAAALGAFAARSVAGRAGATCISDGDCGEGFTCESGNCEDAGCRGVGTGCSSHTQCCEGLICQNGKCFESLRCGVQSELCGSGCCPGLTCSGGYCVPEQPAPPENTGGGNNGGGGSSGGGSNSGGSSGGSTGGGGGGGTTSGGVSVSSLPSTGAGPDTGRAVTQGAGAMVAALGLAGLARRMRGERAATPYSRDAK